MAVQNIQQILRKLEESAEDELALLESTGPEFFTTAQLWRLRGQWEVKHRLFHRVQRGLLHLAAVSPLWIAGWFVFDLLGWTKLSLFFLLLFPVTFTLFFAGLYWMSRFFKSRGHLDITGEMIAKELRQRTLQKPGHGLMD